MNLTAAAFVYLALALDKLHRLQLSNDTSGTPKREVIVNISVSHDFAFSGRTPRWLRYCRWRAMNGLSEKTGNA